MKTQRNFVLYAICFFVIVSSCQKKDGDSEIFSKLESLLPDRDLGEVGAVIIVPLENACSSCSISALQQLSRIEKRHKSRVQLVLTAKSFKLIDQVATDLDLSGFFLHRDGNYSFWKHQMVMNSPSFYLIKGNTIIEDGNVAVQEVPDFVEKLLNHLEI
ncbi:hypothetical protein [Cyclobacterium sp. SYSU L10401]|uniref:hypothetical protein n=1 Tax=Cyclobacterium sp. SYSU L10401 TaxID=2678657 RepID=UPI0013D04495|nr:hypothetical protein [Cyclobacterium sp. SYSU L10401]